MITGADIVKTALSHNGAPYVYGATGGGGAYDCSGLTQAVYASYGIKIPRTSEQQWGAVQHVDQKDLQPGDLVFAQFAGDDASPGHVGIYIGNGQVLSARDPSQGTGVDSLSSWGGHIVGYGRPGGVGTGVGSAAADSGGSSWGTGASVPQSDGTVSTGSALTDDQKRSTYLAAETQLSGLFGVVPELQDKLNQAVAGGWTTDQFMQAVQTTDWYRTHAQSVRSAMALQTSDPATWNLQVSNKRYALEHIAGQIGVTNMTSAQANELAAQAVTFGLDDTTLQRLIAYQFYDPNAAKSGQAAQAYQQLEQLNSDYNAGWSEADLNGQVRQLISGQTTIDTYKQLAINSAISKYPGLTQQLKSGLSVADIAGPYKSTMSQLLELDPQAVSTNDPMITRAMQNTGGTAVQTATTPNNASLGGGVGIETSTGIESRAAAAAGQIGSSASSVLAQSPQPMWAFQNTVRQDPRWQYTNNAKQTTSSWLLQVGRDWGFAT